MKYLIVCIGNPDGGDDAVGPYIARRLSHEIDTNSFDGEVLDVGVIPENYTGVIKEKNPETVIIIDAVDMNLAPGQIRMIPPESIGVMHVSTHGIPLSVIIRYVKQYIRHIMLIGIQPKQYTEQMSDSIINAADRLVHIILNDDLDTLQVLGT
jgi:hydrogenase 3 maturation protease